MPFSVDNIARVDIALGGQSQTRPVFGRGLLITANTGLSAGTRAALFSSVQEILAFTDGGGSAVFSPSDPVVEAARAFYRTQGRKRRRPRGGILLSRWVDTATPGIRTGSTPDSVANIMTLVAGAAAGDFTLGGVDSPTAAFATFQTAVAAASDEGDLAAALQNLVQSFSGFSNVTVAYDSTNTVYILTNPDGPNGATAGSIADDFGFGSSAVETQTGAAAETLTEALQAAHANTGGSLGRGQFLVFERALTASEAEEVTDWTADSNYIPWIEIEDPSGEALVANETTSDLALVSATEAEQAIALWTQDADHKAICAAGGFAGIDLDSPNTAQTLKFMPLPGRTPDEFTTAQKAELDRKRANYLATWGNVSFVAEGVTLGPGVWAGTWIWAQWLKHTWEAAYLNAFVNAGAQIPKTVRGRARLYSIGAGVLNRGVLNGGIGRGRPVDEESANEIRDIAGDGVINADNTLPNGWVLWMDPQYREDDPRRQYGRFWIAGAEAIHNITLTGNLIEGANPITVLGTAA